METYMAKARVVFKELLQNSQMLGSNDEHMISRVTFDLEIGGKSFKNLQATIKQPLGSSFEKTGLEVSKPEKYDGPFNYAAFRDAAEAYYRGLVGSTGLAIRVGGGRDVRMSDNVFKTNSVAEFEVAE
jgi:hypothetical protein